MMNVEPAELQAMMAYLGPIVTGEACEPIVRQIPTPLLGHAWPQVAEMVSGVVDRSDGRWTLDDVTTRLVSGDWQLWIVWDGTVKAVLATELMIEASGMRVARIVFATGSGAPKWSHLIADLEVWAKAQECAKLEMMARKGWARHLPDYKMTHVLLERDLT